MPTLYDFLNSQGDQGWEVVAETFEPGQVTLWSANFVHFNLGGPQTFTDVMKGYLQYGWEPCSLAFDANGDANFLFRQPVKSDPGTIQIRLKRPTP